MPSMLDSAKAPASHRSRACRPRSRPSRVAPARTSQDRRRRGVAHPEVLVPGQLDADRPAEHERRGRGERIDDQVLAAERATERRSGHPDGRHRPAEQAGQLPARVEGALRRAGEVEDAVLVERRRRDLRLEVALVDPARGEASLDDDVAARQGRRDVAAPKAVACRDVVRAGLVGRELLGPAADRGMLRLGAGRSRLPRRAARVGPAGRPVRTRARGRPPPPAASSRPTTSGAASAAASRVSATTSATGWPAHRISFRANGSWTPVVALADDRQVGGGQDGHDAGDRERRRDIDPLDPGVGRHGEHGPGVEQAAHLVVGGEPGLAGDLRPAIDTRDRAPDRAGQGIRACVHRCHRTRRDLFVLLGWVVQSERPRREEDDTMSIRRLIRLAVVGWIVSMIVGAIAAMKAKQTIGPDTDESADAFSASAIFGPLAYHSTAKALREGKLECWYGGGVLDLRDATLAPEGATLSVRAIFGGGQILVPAGWRVVDVRPRSRRGPGHPPRAGPRRGRAPAERRGDGLRRRLRDHVGARRRPGRVAGRDGGEDTATGPSVSPRASVRQRDQRAGDDARRLSGPPIDPVRPRSEPRQQSNANQHNSLRSRWSSSTSSRISSGSRARCHWHSRRPAASRSSSALPLAPP